MTHDYPEFVLDRCDQERSSRSARLTAEGKVKVTIEQQPIESINTVFSPLKERKVNGCVVLRDWKPQLMKQRLTEG